MRKIVVFILLSVNGLLWSGCGKQEAVNAPAPVKPTSGPTDAEIPVVVNDNVQVVQITADDTMHFNGNRFTVHTGQPVRVDLTNKGLRPVAEMAHNFVIIKPGIDAMMFNLACAQAKANAYMPADQAKNVITFTTLAGPGQTVSAAFNAPAVGQYTFLCNFPGHYAAGMHGTMTVAP